MKLEQLTSVLDFQGGSQPPKKDFESQPSKSNIRFLQIRDFKTDDKIVYIPISKKNRLCKKEDILIARYGASVGQILSGKEGAYNVALMKVIDKNELYKSRYLYYFFNSPYFQKNLLSRSERSAQAGFNKEDLSEIKIPVPSLQDQEKIVRRLEQMNSSVNTNKNIINNRIEKLQTLKKSYEKNIFQSSGEQALLKDLCNMTQGVQILKSKQKSTRVNNGWSRYFYISDFKTDKNIKYVENEYPKKVFSEKDVIVVNTGASAGDVFKGFSGILSNNLFKVEITDKRLSNDYLYSFLKSSVFKDYQITKYKGTANPHMGHENFGNTPILLPSLEIQERIVEQLSNLYKIVNHNTWSQSLEFSDKLFKAYLNKEFSYE